MQYEIYVDLDGVLADYEDEYRRLTGGDPSEKGKTKARRFRDFPHFYRNLPLLPNAMKLWDFVKHYCTQHKTSPKILSAASNYLKSSREDKEAWVHQYLRLSKGPDVIIVNYPNEKWKHAKPNAILIDDNAKNCEEWKHAGGIAIRHHNVDATIRDLKALFEHVETHHVTETFEAMKQAEPLCENVVGALNEIHDFLTGTEPTDL